MSLLPDSYREAGRTYTKSAFSLMGDAVSRGDLEALTTMWILERLTETDFASTFKSECIRIGADSMHVTDRLGELASKVLEANDSIRAICEAIQKSMVQLARFDSDSHTATWRQQLDSARDTLRSKAVEVTETLRSWGQDKILELSPELRPLAAKGFIRGLQAVLDFVSKALGWLCKGGCLSTDWIRNASESSQDWGKDIAAWFLASRQEIFLWFATAGLNLRQRRLLNRRGSSHNREALVLNRIPETLAYALAIESPN